MQDTKQPQAAKSGEPKRKPRNLYHMFETDKKLEQEGITLQFGDAKFTCKRAGGSNRQFDTIFNERTRALSTKLQMASLSQEQSDAILIEVFFDAVVTGWEDVTGRDGELLPYTRENFIQIMKDLPDLWKSLRSAAADMDSFLVVQKKVAGETVGNS